MEPFRKNVAVAIDGGGSGSTQCWARSWSRQRTAGAGYRRYFDEGLGFRRFQVDLRENIGMDAADKISELETHGDELWDKVLNDRVAAVPDFWMADRPSRKKKALRGQSYLHPVSGHRLSTYKVSLVDRICFRRTFSPVTAYA